MSSMNAILPIIGNLYIKIRDIESNHIIFGEEGDFRPRIEHFQDAIRAYSVEIDITNKNCRLSIENIAYDVAMLRYIQIKPLHAGRGKQHLSSKYEIIKQGGKERNISRPDRATRQKLSQLYKDYTILFIALLGEKADNNSRIRTSEAEEIIADCEMMQNLLSGNAKGEINIEDLINGADSIESDDLRNALLTLFKKIHKLVPYERQKASLIISEVRAEAFAEIDKIDKEGCNLDLNKLTIYEKSRETVKRLAGQGLNIGGKFVEQTANRDIGQGRTQ